MRTKLLALLVALASIELHACGSGSFQGGGGKATRKNPSLDGNGVDRDDGSGLVETFDVTTARGLLDLVWVIDNSGSMEDKIAKVQQNFQAFMDSVKERADLRIILISQAAVRGSEYTFGIQLPADAAAQGHVQIDLPVGSYNPMAMAAAATCEASQTSVVNDSTMRICGKEFHGESESGYIMVNGSYGPYYGLQYDEGPVTYFEDMPTIARAAGQARQHFRDGAQRAFVFVTDEDSFVFAGDDFASAVKAADPSGAPRLYAFRGAQLDMGFPDPYGGGVYGQTQPGGCTVSYVGKAYDRAAQTMGGETFDICANDWRPQFDRLSASVSALARNRFTLKSTGFARVAKVEVDGKEVPQAKVTVSGQVVAIDASAMPSDAKVVKIYLDR